jgi:XTP/dITP diphosphohydrolase
MTPSRRRLETDGLVIASHNSGKVEEIATLLAPFRIRVVSAAALGVPEPEETGNSFSANAILKARACAAITHRPSLADDSGLVVPALDGAPGIYSARWAGASRDFSAAMLRVHTALGERERRAHFICVLALAWPDGDVECFEGRIDGTLVWPPRGERGFGYDPMFQPDGHTETFGEMAPDAKHAISHRAHAFAHLTRRCFGT